MTVDMSESARAAFGWSPELKHAPQSPTDKNGKFYCTCRCGFESRPVATPSHAYTITRLHAEAENHCPRPQAPAPSAGRAPERAPEGSSRACRGGGGTPCGCGCGEPSGGLFRPGHDSKLLSRLLNEIRSGAKTLADAHAEMDVVGTSDKLKAKLAQKAGVA